MRTILWFLFFTFCEDLGSHYGNFNHLERDLWSLKGLVTPEDEREWRTNSKPWRSLADLCVTSGRSTSCRAVLDPGRRWWGSEFGEARAGSACACRACALSCLRSYLGPWSMGTLEKSLWKVKLWENFTEARSERIKAQKKGLGEEFVHPLIPVYWWPPRGQNLF